MFPRRHHKPGCVIRDLDFLFPITCIPGCSQNNGMDPRICMKDETLSSRKITCLQQKERGSYLNYRVVAGLV